MKHLKSILSILVLLAASSLAACNLSQATLVSVTPGPNTDTTITVQVCFGYGVTGTTNGADGDTRTIAFGWFSQSPSFAVNSFTPANITGVITGCPMSGNNLGAVGPPFNSQGTVLFADPGYYGIEPCASTPFTCVNSTASCGNIGQQCINFSFVVTNIPDSMRVFGVEGGGNALAGCYPDSDMLISFDALRVEYSDPELEPIKSDPIDTPMIYPNPVRDILNISLLGQSRIEVFGMDGMKLLELTDCHSDLELIDFSSFASGQYVIVIRNGQRSFSSIVRKY